LGLSGQDIIYQIYEEVVSREMEQEKKIKVMDVLAECEYRLTVGANEKVQLDAFLAKLSCL